VSTDVNDNKLCDILPNETVFIIFVSTFARSDKLLRGRDSVYLSRFADSEPIDAMRIQRFHRPS